MKKIILIFLLLFLVLCLIFTGLGSLFPGIARKIVVSAEQGFSQFIGLNSIELTIAIFQKNVISTVIVAFTTCYLFGIPIFAFLLLNTVLIGAFLSIYPGLIIGLIPHGLIEIPAVCIALALGWNIWRRREGTWVKISKQDIMYFLKTVMPLLLLAAIIEVYITPRIMDHFAVLF